MPAGHTAALRDEFIVTVPLEGGDDYRAVADRIDGLDNRFPLDEMRNRMQQWQREREGRRGSGEDNGSGPTASSDRRGDGRGRGMGMGFGGRGDGRGRGPGTAGFRDPRSGLPPREMRKQFSESRDPDAHAQRMAYFNALHQRAKERGIEMPFPRGMRRPGPR